MCVQNAQKGRCMQQTLEGAIEEARVAYVMEATTDGTA